MASISPTNIVAHADIEIKLLIADSSDIKSPSRRLLASEDRKCARDADRRSNKERSEDNERIHLFYVSLQQESEAWARLTPGIPLGSPIDSVSESLTIHLDLMTTIYLSQAETDAHEAAMQQLRRRSKRRSMTRR